MESKIKYIRCTHDENNNFREDMRKKWDACNTPAYGLIHMLDPRQWKTSQEVFDECLQYDEQYPTESWAYSSIEEIEEDLELLVDADMARRVG